MSTIDPTELGRQMHQAFNERNFAAVETIFAPEFYSHPLDAGRDAVKASWRAMSEKNPAAHSVVDEVFTDGDRVALRATIHGIGADGETSTLLEMFRVVDGRITELWGSMTIRRPH